jgi:hypothetical protein
MIKKRNIDQETRLRDIGEWIEVDLTAGAANAFAVALQNPYTVNLLITEIIIRITTAGGTGSSVLDVDVAADATSTGDTIFDGIDLNASAPAIYSSHNVADTGTNGNEKPHLWEAAGGTNDYLTAKILVQNASTLVGKMYIHVIEAL